MGKSHVKVVHQDRNRISQLTEFLKRVADAAKTSNIDHYFRSGSINHMPILKELGEHFLRTALGFENDEFIPFVGNSESPQFVPQSEDYYPWAFYVNPTSDEDLLEIFHKRAMQYLLSDGAGKKNYAIITNFKRVGVFDLKHELPEYSFELADLYDSINNTGEEKKHKKAMKAWEAFLKEFGPESSKEKKKQRRQDVIKYVEPKEDRVGFVKRFGHMPNFEKPIGWDNKNFQETFRTKNLPFLETETFDWDGSAKKLENRLIWGDNLAVMRSLPSESVDLIYVDPPFFSGRDYNLIFGDDDEVRSFSDIWDGGLPTYLAWLNARLWEMKRLLKPTGSIYVHLDWHAAHYVKCEMDKIFGNGGKDGNGPGFKANIIWSYSWGVRTEKRWNRKHDDILFYSKDKTYTFNADAVLEERKLGESSKKRLEYKGALIKDHNKRGDSEKALPTDVWHLSLIHI